jgi:hypothetical protein
LTLQDKFTIERALGLIEGLAYGCKECWFQIVELSRKKRSDTE